MENQKLILLWLIVVLYEYEFYLNSKLYNFVIFWDLSITNDIDIDVKFDHSRF